MAETNPLTPQELDAAEWKATRGFALADAEAVELIREVRASRAAPPSRERIAELVCDLKSAAYDTGRDDGEAAQAADAAQESILDAFRAMERERDEAREDHLRVRDECFANMKVAAEERARAEAAEAAKDGAYRERDQVVALAARMAAILCWPTWLGRHEDKPGDPPWEDDWRNIVFIDLPSGQVSWHIHDSEEPLVRFLPSALSSVASPWDGHDMAEKYRRCDAPWPPARPSAEAALRDIRTRCSGLDLTVGHTAAHTVRAVEMVVERMQAAERERDAARAQALADRGFAAENAKLRAEAASSLHAEPLMTEAMAHAIREAREEGRKAGIEEAGRAITPTKGKNSDTLDPRTDFYPFLGESKWDLLTRAQQRIRALAGSSSERRPPRCFCTADTVTIGNCACCGAKGNEPCRHTEPPAAPDRSEGTGDGGGK